jgi:hypothetical protein
MDAQQARQRAEDAERALREVEASLRAGGTRAQAAAPPQAPPPSPTAAQPPSAAAAPPAPASPQPALPAARESGEPPIPAAPAAASGVSLWPGLEHAPVIAIHGVGNFEYGDVIAQIASSRVFSEGDDFRRQTLYADNYRYTLLEDDKPSANGRPDPRLLEVNWCDIRKPLANALGLMRNFVLVLLAILRIGVYGAEGSATLGRPLRTPAALYVFEGLLVWSSLLPVLSALLWKFEVGPRFGVGIGIALAAFYVAWLVRNISLPLTAGGAAFGALSIAAGWFSCTGVQRVQEEAADGTLRWVVAGQPGRDLVTTLAGGFHSWAVVITGVVLTLTALEVLLLMKGDDGRRPPLTQRFARIACLWLPLVMLVIVQPLAVSALLVTLNADQQQAWGAAFEAGMAFHPRAGQFAGSLVALALLTALLLGGLQYKLVNWRGRNGTMALCLLLGLGMIAAAYLAKNAEDLSCRCCTRPDWIVVAGVMLLLSGAVTYWLYREQHAWQIPGEAKPWHPSGDCARLWAVCLLWGFPLVLMAALAILFWHTGHGPQVLAPFIAGYGPCDLQGRTVHADQAFLQSTKYALLLLPLATKPFAALLDALGDVFYFVVKQPSLQTREDTLPRLGRAIQSLSRYATGRHLIVFAHSQGTAIAAALLSRLSDALAAGAGRITLITCGSPVTSLYAQFLGVRLGGEFAQLCSVQPQRFAWLNICRPADYIGSAVELPGVRNEALLTPGDHTGYWTDASLLQCLADCTLDIAPQASAHPERLRPIVPW